MTTDADHPPQTQTSKCHGSRLRMSSSRPAAPTIASNANKMTSFSATASTSATPQLFTIPAGPDVARAGGDGAAHAA